MEITRRNALKIIGATPVAAGLGLGDTEATDAGAGRASRGRGAPGGGRLERPLQAEVLHRARIRDGHAARPTRSSRKTSRSGSASDAGVPQFIDFTMTDRLDKQTPMRGGLRWLDHEANLRFGKPFIECAAADRTAILDDIAYPNTRDARVHPGRGVLHVDAGPGRDGVLHEPDRHRRPAATWATVRTTGTAARPSASTTWG